MATLRALVLRTRTARHSPHLSPGLPADEDVLLDAPDERLAPALVAAAHGDHGPAAGLLAATRDAAEWEERDRYLTRLAAFARSRDEWLRTWCATDPDDPDALLLRAELALTRAWGSPARTELLGRMTPLIVAATGVDPRDPVPWRLALDHARGSGAGHRDFERLWGEAVSRSPHHYGCHVAALRYLASRWTGSYGACLDFAETAAQDARRDSLVQALPLRAAFSCLEADGGASVAGARLHAAADRAIGLSARYAVGDPWPAEVRNLLAHVLAALERWEDALTQLRMTGPYATSFPWDRERGRDRERSGRDPLGAFLELRARVAAAARPAPAVREARSFLSFGGRTGHVARFDH
ncbi:hypothetical protein AB0C59_22990 [Streptomyces sp. NPDC048664]|uniref:hypothetical protein n=1 Tax=Streptomyces sp. NPDC048664 TaxID=3154505 RepID=UPI003415F9FD